MIQAGRYKLKTPGLISSPYGSVNFIEVDETNQAFLVGIPPYMQQHRGADGSAPEVPAYQLENVILTDENNQKVPAPKNWMEIIALD